MDSKHFEKLDKDRHLGHIILESFKKIQPDHIAQINGDTDEKESYGSLFNRTVRLARSLTNFGCRPGDVIALAGTNHLDLALPFFAGMINGLPTCGIDPYFKFAEIKSALDICKPKIVFCDYNSQENYMAVAKEIGVDITIVTFILGELSLQKFIEKYDDNSHIEDFRPPIFDPNEIYAWLVSTSGTTGVPKFVALKQNTVLAALTPQINAMPHRNDNEQGEKICLLLSTIQWISAFSLRTVGLLAKVCLLSSTKTYDIDHIIDIINKYKPKSGPASPSIWALIMQSAKPCDLTCLEVLPLGGAPINKHTKDELQKRLNPEAIVIETYGQTETIGGITLGIIGVTPPGSCGGIMTGGQAKLVNENGEEITEPYVPGELLYKGTVFDGYYNNPEETAKVFTEDGWLRTGDQLYRDDSENYYFVERLKMIIKYRNIHIIPIELEELIRQHPGVQDVCVTSVDHPTDQQWPVAVVVKKPGANVTEDEIQNIVAENLSDAKKLRGGVVFIDKLPLTPNGKVARMELRTIAATARR